MARSTSLPDRLRYLQPFRKKFASRPEELNEDTGEAPLFALFSKRIKGLSESDAQKLLEEDLAALEEWLSAPEHENDCLQFVRGFLLVSPTELAKRILEESANPAASLLWAEIDLPDEAKVKRIANRDGTAVILKWKGLMVLFNAMPKELAESFAESAGREYAITSSPVRFGNGHGTKLVGMDDVVSVLGTHYKVIKYFLEAPGGHVSIEAIAFSKKINKETWDESILENLFHTLRVVEKQKTVGENAN